MADMDDFTLETGQDLVDLCSVSQGAPLYADATMFCYGVIEGIIQYHDAVGRGPDGDLIVCPEGAVAVLTRSTPSSSGRVPTRRRLRVNGRRKPWSRLRSPHGGRARSDPLTRAIEPENGRSMMRKVALPLAMTGMLVLAGCQGMDADTGGRGTVGGAAIGAAGGALIGAIAGAPGTGAAIGAVAGGTSGVVCDQYKKKGG